MEKKLILFDTDCGVDDAQAIMVALAAPNVRILGITCCKGNTSVDNVCKNVLRVLEICKKSEIPVFRGASSSLLAEAVHAVDFHGADGLGNVPDPNAPGLEHVKKEHGVNALIRMATEHAGKVSLIATGPLTNLALAVKMDPTFTQKLKALYIMGGNMESRGNTTVCGEFNFVIDPEAAYIALNEFTCPIYIATWEFTCESKLSWEFYDAWVGQETDKARFVKKISAHSQKIARSDRGEKELVSGSGFVPCDSYAVAAAIDETIVKEYMQCGVSVELNGKHTRGMLVIDTLDILEKKNKIFVMKSCDIEKFKALLNAAVK
ncbi:inosine-uridine preferring nucleoside hydrolase-like isoform X2 [Protopterus annectens]|nr:inosine-uridine preferring nucleoside hydrolase-like isoform X2 [Protopterus annectens]